MKLPFEQILGKELLLFDGAMGTLLQKQGLQGGALAARFGDNPRAMRQAGIMYATEQIIDLYANGVNHVHIYTMNRPDIAREIFANLSEIFLPEETAHETAV